MFIELYTHQQRYNHTNNRGLIMATQMIIRVESGLKNKISQIAKSEGKNLSELVRELLVKYTRERDIGPYINELWDRIGKKLTQSGISETDIPQVIKQARSKNV